MDLTLENLRGDEDPRIAGDAGVAGGEDFMGKLNSIITGINTLFENYDRMRKNVNALPKGQGNGKVMDNEALPGVDSQAILKAVDQQLLQFITKMFSNQVFTMPLNELISEFGDLSIVQAMEKFAKEGPQSK